MPFLRCFGSKVLNLSTIYGRHPEAGRMDRYINQYCSDTVTCIGFINHHSFSNGFFQKPFKNVDEVHITKSKLKDQLTNFVNWFPNMRRLDMHVVAFDEAIEVSFPHLEHVSLLTTNENVIKFLHVNQPLQSIEIRSYIGITLSEILNMISGNSSISKLAVTLMNSGNTATMAELMRFSSEHPMIIELFLSDYQLLAGDVIVLLGQLTSLKKFTCVVKNRLECNRLLNQLGNQWQHEISTLGVRRYIELNR